MCATIHGIDVDVDEEVEWIQPFPVVNWETHVKNAATGAFMLTLTRPDGSQLFLQLASEYCMFCSIMSLRFYKLASPNLVTPLIIYIQSANYFVLGIWPPMHLCGNVCVLPVTEEEFQNIQHWENVHLVFLPAKTPETLYQLRQCLTGAMLQAQQDTNAMELDEWFVWDTYWQSIAFWLNHHHYETM